VDLIKVMAKVIRPQNYPEERIPERKIKKSNRKQPAYQPYNTA
jgi:hypothetical protein